MSTQVIDTFQRVEDKYRMTRQEAREILEEMKGHIKKDDYFQQKKMKYKW